MQQIANGRRVGAVLGVVSLSQCLGDVDEVCLCGQQVICRLMRSRWVVGLREARAGDARGFPERREWTKAWAGVGTAERGKAVSAVGWPRDHHVQFAEREAGAAFDPAVGFGAVTFGGGGVAVAELRWPGWRGAERLAGVAAMLVGALTAAAPAIDAAASRAVRVVKTDVAVSALYGEVRHTAEVIERL